MIVGFSGRGTGCGSGPTEYLTDDSRKGREHEPPQIVRGDPEQTRDLIDSLDFKHKYTSGVLSFSPNEKITPEMEDAIIERFEKVAFSGLEPDQYNILWVRHTHAGHHELHFVTPRVELSTGKSFNIKPPGQLAQDTFDDFRSEINARYGLSDPTDPNRARNVSTPNHELKMAAEARRNGEKPLDDIRQLVDGVLTERAAQGLIRSRSDVLEHVKELGFEVKREGKDYITVAEPESGGRWRLKGELYARDYEPSRTLERAEEARKRDYSRPDGRAAKDYADRVERHIERRAGYNQNRYSKPKPKHRLETYQKPIVCTNACQPSNLSRHLQRELGNDALLFESSHGATEQRPNLGERGWQNSVEPVRRQSPPLRDDRREGGDVRRTRGMADIERVLDDRARKALTERIQAIRDAVQRAAERFTKDVQEYIGRKSGIAAASKPLDGASQQLKQASAAIQRVVQHEQTLERQQKPTQRMSHSQGMSR